MDDILNKLNDSQRNAVVYNDGPSLVIAGAGSGKTRVLTYKIAYLLNQGYLPNNILAITFTNKAANEMKSRIADIVGEQTARHLWMGTFHSIFARILRIEAAAVGFSSNFTIYDTADAKSKIKDIVKELGLNDKYYTHKVLLSRISKMKNSLVTPNSYEKRYDLQEFDRLQNIPRFKEIYRIYMNQCHRANAMDFDDLLLYTNVLFRDNAEILKKYQDIFKFILVDEYQDTNFAQHLIVTKLAEQHHKLCVVGDDAQSIYSFRGANIDNILKFKDVYPEYRLFKLEQNYRSTKTILNAANAVISHNLNRKAKTLWTDAEDGEKIRLFYVDNPYVEADRVIAMIRKYLHEGYSLNSCACLYRTNAQSRALEEAFIRANIPYKIVGGVNFYQRKEIKDILSYLKTIDNGQDDVAVRRIINVPKRSIGAASVNMIQHLADERGISFYAALDTGITEGVFGRAGDKLRSFRELIEGLRQDAKTMPLPEFYDQVLMQTGYLRMLDAKDDLENRARKENVQELKSSIVTYVRGVENPTLAGFLEEVSLYTDIERYDQEADAAVMMTMHSAKGLEFPSVYLVGMEEGLFPGMKVMTDPDELEEERRLCYVAITRAKQQLFLSYARQRMLYGRTTFNRLSRFLEEIPEEYLDTKNKVQHSATGTHSSAGTGYSGGYSRDYTNSKRAAYRNPHLKPKPNAPMLELSKGDQVVHTAFGDGLVINILKMNGDALLEVAFDKVGTKKLMLKTASAHLKKKS